MDALIIQGLSVHTQIGVYAWEQKIKQQLLIDIHIPSDFKRCKDELSDTLDYDDLCKKVTLFVESKSFQLIEYLANSVAQLVKVEFGVEQVNVSVTKPHAVKNAGMIKVSVTR
ncbi:dihydroneopterin aldolase [Legionella sp. km772]|uniref:dihydroneopterin aldolase n=1 Tax=Legionella sp. km772 TaxID=2498111 RepID=UPI000F8F6863|nr:dihydroneopterin aldolase [Legionella sp. km772]RUR08814.1 dihydroneopterin aldolase [Legionella sp. km772]